MLDKKWCFGLWTVVVLAALMSGEAHASTGAGGVPWEGPLLIIVNSLKGPVAIGIGIIGFVVAGGTMVFGGEMGDFGRRSAMLALVVSVLVLATNFLSVVFGVSGAVI